MYQIPFSLKQIHLGKKQRRKGKQVGKNGKKMWERKKILLFCPQSKTSEKKVGESSTFIYTFTKAVPKF